MHINYKTMKWEPEIKEQKQSFSKIIFDGVVIMTGGMGIALLVAQIITQ